MTNSVELAATLAIAPRKMPRESLPGYAMRLAVANFMPSATWLPLSFSETTQHVGNGVLHRIASDKHALTDLERLARYAPGALVAEQWVHADSAAGPYVRSHGQVMPVDAFMIAHAQVCPLCLKSPSPYLHEDWDLSHVTVCGVHKVTLTDACWKCGGLIQWSRPVLVSCGRCGADLRNAPVQPCDDRDALIGDFAASLAPFRLRGSSLNVESPETLFDLIRLLSAPLGRFLEGKRATGFSKLRIAQRYAATHEFSRCLDDRVVDGHLLHVQFSSRLAHWVPYLGQEEANDRLFQLIGAGQVSPEVRRLIAFESDEARVAPAHIVFAKLPPRMFKRADVCAFLGCTLEQFSDFVEKGLVVQPRRGHAYDADQILACRRRLQGLLSARALDASVGIPGFCEQLVAANVLRAELYSTGQPVFSAETLGFVLDTFRSISIFHEARPGKDLVTLSQFFGRSIAPTALAQVFAAILGNRVDAFHWTSPFGWQQMALSTGTLEAIAADPVHKGGREAC